MRGEEEIEHGRKLFAQECRFVSGAVSESGLPSGQLPEVAFLGRSNVGKSSLVNALTGRKTLARVSNTPGRTRELNFFCLAEKLMLVDMPGYGYARQPKEQIARWTRLAKLYLKGRRNLKRVILLVDSRHGIKPSDEEFMSLLDEYAVSYQIVLTKTDKIHYREGSIRGFAPERHSALHPEIIGTSSVSGAGIGELRAAIAEFVKY